MTKIILPLLVALILSGCGTLKKHTKTDSEATKTETTSTTKTETTTKTAETKTITEKAQDTIKTKEDNVKGTESLADLLEGDTLRAETEFTSVKVFYDPNSGTLVAEATSKEREIPVDIDRTTVVTTEKTEEAKTEKKDEAKTEHEVTHEETRKERESGSSTFLWGAGIGFLILLILYLAYRYLKKIFLP